MILKRIYIPVILLGLLVIEGIAIDLLPDVVTTTEILIVPHWVLTFLVLVTLFYDAEHTVSAIVYGIIFGFLIDVVYTNILGVYMFVYPFSLYIVHLLKRLLQTNFLMTLLFGMVAITVTEVLILFIYSFIDVVNSSQFYFILFRLLPTLLANVFFLMFIYFVFHKRLNRWRSELLEK